MTQNRRQRLDVECLGIATLLAAASITLADGVQRDLSPSFTPYHPFTVTITIDPPQGTGVVGLEEKPPAGWQVTNISAAGTYDDQTASVKWGPYFAPAIPDSVSFDITAPSLPAASRCFEGAASFDGVDTPITGDACFAQKVPAESKFAVFTCILMAALCGVWTLDRCNRKSQLHTSKV